jgi:filamentous hemagglutinin family protein
MFRMSTCGAWFIPIATVFWCNCASAQITPDATLPNNSIININGKTFNVTGGTTAGTNLFHSFKDFSVPNGSEAFFNNTVDIQNIISRVTGGSISDINGLIRTLGTANLFLINPNGIVFGPNASLNIGGSFIASTANSINFADGTKFSATPSQDLPLLTITAPLGLNMGSNPGPILVQGPKHDINYENIAKLEDVSIRQARPPIDTSFTGLQVKQGQTLGLVGGNVSLEGGVLKSPAGRIEIGSVGSNGVVSLAPIQQGWKLSYDAPSFGDIQFSQKTFVSTTGLGGGSIAVAGKNISLTASSILQADTLGDRNGGEISFVGEKIVLNQSNMRANTYSSGNGGQIKLLANNITFENLANVITQASSTGDGGQINLIADNIRFENFGNVETTAWGTGKGGQANLVANNITIANQSGVGTKAWDTGGAGNINISANSFLLESSGVESSTERNSTAKAGDVNIQVAGSMVVNSAGIISDSVTDNAGKVNISANSLQLDNSGVFSRTANPGKVGEINIQVADSLKVQYSGIITESFGSGDNGNINISANSFLLEYSGILAQNAENISGIGKAGDININVAGSFVISYSGIKTNIFGGGDAGKINISANSLQMDTTGIDSNSSGTGNAGQITVNAQFLEISNSEISVQTTGSGNAGNLQVRAKTVNLDSEGKLRVSSTGSGNGGTLKVVADTIKLDNQSRIDATTTSGNGGDLKLDVANLLLLRNGSQISATAGSAQQGGDGGNITINARDGIIVAVPNENSDITANAFTGIGGQIEINTSGLFGIQPSFELTPNNDITAFSQSGISGEITINRADVEQRLESVELPTVVADTSNIIDTSCAAFAEGEGNSFTVTGRGGLPPSPYEPLSSDVLWSDTRIPNIASQQRSEKPSTKPPTAYDAVKIVPATGWVFDGKGNVTLISHASNGNLGSTAACQNK